MGRACSTHGKERYDIWDFGGKTEGKIPLGKPTHRLNDNIEMDLREI
jgi:hypothetical protein